MNNTAAYKRRWMQSNNVTGETSSNQQQVGALGDDYFKSDHRIINPMGYRGAKGRRALRQTLNSNPDAAVYMGDQFQQANSKGRFWTRRDVRRLKRDTRNGFNNLYKTNGSIYNPVNQVYNFINENPMTRTMKWKASQPTTNTTDTRDYTQPWATLTKPNPNFINWAPFRNVKTPVLAQQGGELNNTQQPDQNEQILLYGVLGYIGSKEDVAPEEAIQTVATAFIQNPESLKEIIQNENLIKKGAQIMQQKHPEMLKQITQPGALMQIVNKLMSNIKQAKMGTKLDYIKNLRPFYCPEGMEVEFKKVGGKICPVCKKSHAKGTPHKAENGEKVEKNCGGGISGMMKGIKAALKCGGKMKKMEEGGETYTVAQRDSLIKDFNKNPNINTYRKIQQANQFVSDIEDQRWHPRINTHKVDSVLREEAKKDKMLKEHKNVGRPTTKNKK